MNMKWKIHQSNIPLRRMSRHPNHLVRINATIRRKKFPINIESSYEEISQINNVEYNQEVITPELNEDDVSVSRNNIIVIESELVNINGIDDFDNLTNGIDETGESEFTFNEKGVYQDLLFISKFESNLNFLLIDAFYNKITYSESSLNENDDITTKIFELKEKLLLKHDMLAYFDNQVVDEIEEIACINKITTDFAYYIDNSIVGADSMVNFQSCFSNFKSYFYTIFLIFGDNFLRDADFINYCWIFRI